MDVNNTPYFLLRTADDFDQSSHRLRWNRAVGALTLAQNQTLRLPVRLAPAAARSVWENSRPLAVDGFGQLGRLSPDRTGVEYHSGQGDFEPLRDDALQPLTAPIGRFRDLTLGGDGRLALPFSDDSQHGLLLFHLGRRWQTRCDLSADPATGTPLPTPRRAWVDRDNRIWLITANHLLLCQGQPLPQPYQPLADRFEPETLNPRDLQLCWSQPLPADQQALALCADDDNLYLLVHDSADQQAILVRPRSDRPDLPFQHHPCADDLPFLIDLAPAHRPGDPHGIPGRLAALAPPEPGDTDFRQRDATLLELSGQGDRARARLVQERYPLQSLATPRFVSSTDGQLRYPALADPARPHYSPRPLELHPLRHPQYPLEASAVLHQILDSGQPDCIWHRLYLDASIPSGCDIQIHARVYASPDQRSSAPLWQQPAPLWNPLPSELPFAPALAGQEPGRRGLFEILLQRLPDRDDKAGPVRRLTGRYLQLQVTLRSNGRQTPVLHAIRVYAPRFSWQEAWLPELYRQEQDVQPDATGPANGADVRERLLAAFEGMLTPLEGRIAASARLTHPDATPPEHLPWLAEILGTDLPPRWPLTRQRRLVRETTLAQQYRGTLFGVQLALDIATDGGLQRGDIVLVENFRLRRTLATLLGISMDDADHPLTLGTGMSGNSIIGDSLILAESDAREFLALFDPDQTRGIEKARVKKFFDDYAHQITVLLHGPATRQRTTVETVLTEHLPAHLVWRIFETEHPFVLGTSPLLSLDTYLETTPAPRRIDLDHTWLGREGVVTNPVAFSPAAINALTATPALPE